MKKGITKRKEWKYWATTRKYGFDAWQRLNDLLEEKDKNNAQLKSELKDIKSYLRQIREGTKKFLWN